MFHSQPHTTQHNTNIQSSPAHFNNHIPPNTKQTNPHINPTSSELKHIERINKAN